MHIQGGHFSRNAHFNSNLKQKHTPINNKTLNKTKRLEAKIKKDNAKKESVWSLQQAKEMKMIHDNPIGPIEIAVNLQATYLLLRRRPA